MNKTEILKIRTLERLGMKKDSILIPQKLPDTIRVSKADENSLNLRS
jgi:hypothetical protein